METAEYFEKILHAYMSVNFLSTRAELGLTQAQMAEELGIDVRSYSDLENGKSLCSATVLLRYLAKFGPKECETDFVYEAGRILTAADTRPI